MRWQPIENAIDEWEPFVKYKGQSWFYINKKGCMYTIRPVVNGMPIEDRSKDIIIHGRELVSDDELNLSTGGTIK